MMPTRLYEIQFREKADTRLFRLNGRPLQKRWQNWGYYRNEREVVLLLESLPAKYPNYEFRQGEPQGEN